MVTIAFVLVWSEDREKVILLRAQLRVVAAGGGRGTDTTGGCIGYVASKSDISIGLGYHVFSRQKVKFPFGVHIPIRPLAILGRWCIEQDEGRTFMKFARGSP